MKSLHLVEPQQPSVADLEAPSPIEQGPASTTQIDRRLPAVRYNVRKVSGRLGAVKNAEVLNLSLTGFAVKTDKYLLIGQSYPVKLLGESAVAVTAEAVWCRMIGTTRNFKDEIEPVYRAGFKFLDLTKESRWSLRKLIRQNGE